jgi:RimJ/RimL family protein N-acetyltransferase
VRGDDAIVSARLELRPLADEDAEAMIELLRDPGLYAFIGGAPPTLDELRARYRRLSEGRSPDGREEWRNWIVRARGDGRAIGTVQATIVDGGQRAEIAWVIGLPWQGQGFASEAARALVTWLEARGVTSITANIHPDHQASATVAARAGLVPTNEVVDGERVWRRDAAEARPGFAHGDR